MRVVHRSRRRSTDASTASRRRLSARGNGWRDITTWIGIVALAAGGTTLWRLLPATIDDAADPVAATATIAQDDASGDLPAASDADRFFPVPAPLDDERVIAALGPIAKLTCDKNDYAGHATTPATPPSDLGPPIDTSDTTSWIDRTVALALSPIAPISESDGDVASDTTGAATRRRLAAPLSSPRYDVDDLLTRNLLAAGLSPIAALPAPESRDCPALLRHTFKKLQTGEPQSLCQFEGKVLLIVNTASYCGYTKQYEGLETMYRKYKDRGLVVVGFPSNDFGGQDPGSNKDIAEFCRTTYGVQFPMFEKSSVARLDANPLHVELAQKTGASPKWNFHKYVVDRNGAPVASFPSDATPDSPKLVSLIERLLAEKHAAAKS